MLSFSDRFTSALADESAEVAWIVKLFDDINSMSLTSWNENITIGLDTFMANGRLLDVVPSRAAVLNTGGNRVVSSVVIADGDRMAFDCFQGFAERELSCVAQIVMVKSGAMTDAEMMFYSRVFDVSHNNSITTVKAGLRLNLEGKNPVYLTDSAQIKRKAGDNVLNQLSRDIYVDWR